MITFKKIKYRNFLSTGQHWTEINFQEYNTNLIIGTNGAGKSTMLDALTFALFNKPFRKINKGQLINTVNEKDCVVEIDDELAVKTCKMHNYKYSVITPDDLVIPPTHDNIQED